ncbi:MAG: class I SAM-dependent methyltransferase [Halobacteriales archaeon]
MRADAAGDDGTGRRAGLADVRALYDRWSRVYDWNPALRLVRPARRRAVAALDLAPGDTVVDLGTGTGANLPFLRRAVGPTGRVVGIDASPGMLARARRRVERRGWANVTVLEGDVRDPPLAGSVDAVLSAFVAVMFDDPGRLVEAWAGHLDGGRMAHLYAGPSDRPSAPAANALLGLYLRAFEAGWATAETRPLAVLAARGERLRAAMDRRAARTDHEQHVLGLVQLSVGRFGG